MEQDVSDDDDVEDEEEILNRQVAINAPAT
jgi:hypothetical protein